MNTRVGVLREVGNFFCLSRADRTWANTTPVEALSSGDLFDTEAGSAWMAGEMPTERVTGRTFRCPEILAAQSGPDREEPSAAAELLELLTWACSPAATAAC
jgi:hypothetical protein